MRESWVCPSMEGSWRIRPSFICGVCSFLEEGTHIAGTSYSLMITDLSVSVERYHTRDSLCAMDSSSELRGSRAHCFSEICNKGRGNTKLWHIYILGTPKHLERSFYYIRFHCIFILFVSRALDITYIYFHSKLVFPEGVYPGSC
jgi:hypothetical protein